MKISEYQQRFSPASRPDVRTVKKWVASGRVYGEKIGNCFYVDPDREPAQPQQVITTSNPLVLAVLAKAARGA